MGFSNVKGKKALDLMADVMELAEGMLDDERVKSLLDGVAAAKGDADKALRVVLAKAPAIIRDARYSERIVSILATLAGADPVEYAETGDVIGDLTKLLTEDVQALSFLSASQPIAASAG